MNKTAVVQKTTSFRYSRRHQTKGTLNMPNQKTVHCGWLWKKGSGYKNQLANRRWFEIKGDQLYYFKDKEDRSSPLGQIPLPGNEIKKHLPGADSSGKYVFELAPRNNLSKLARFQKTEVERIRETFESTSEAGKEREGRPVVENSETMIFGASTPYEMEEWIKAINRVIFSPLGGGMFGRSIIETIKIDSRRGGGFVPIIVEQCVEYIREHGMNEEGIFRVSGSQDDVEILKTAFNTGELKDLSDGDYKVTTVASVLKRYIGDLPDPVIPSENYDQFTTVGAIYKTEPDEAVEKFKNLLEIIPKEHFDLLKYLSRFLFELQSHEKVTKMTMANLALIFGPNLLRPKGEDPDYLLQSLSDVNRTAMAIVMAQEKLFPITDDEHCYSPKPFLSNKSFSILNVGDYDKSKSLPLSPISLLYNPPKAIETLTECKRAFSDSSLNNLIIQNDSIVAENEEIELLRQELETQRLQYEEQIHELEGKVDREVKIREMIKLRLIDEHKARVHAEERLELYRAGIEDYCKKFGHADICIS